MAFVAVSSSAVAGIEEWVLSSVCLKGLVSYKRLEKGSTLSLKSKRDVVQSLRCKDIKELAWDYEGAVWQQVWIYPKLKDLSFWIRPAGTEWAPVLHERGVGMCNSFSWPGVHLSMCDKAGLVSGKMVLITRSVLHLCICTKWVNGGRILVLWLNLIRNGIYENMAWFSCDLQQL